MNEKPFVGELNKKVQIVRLDTTINDVHEQEVQQVVVCEPFAKVVETGGSSLVEGAIMNFVKREYYVRYRSEIEQAQQMRIIDGSQVYEVLHKEYIGRRSYLKLVCSLYQ